MALRTQVDPYVLIGDSLADLPSPAEQKQGILFHERATGQCRVLVIDPATGVRAWEDFCAHGSGPTGPAGGLQLYKFSGTAVFASAQALSTFLADEGGEAAAGTPVQSGSTIAQRYGVVFPSTSATLRVFVRANTLLQPAALQLRQNGVTVLGTVPVPAAFTGPLLLTAPAVLAAGDGVDAVLVLSAAETVGRAVELSAVLTLS